MTDFDSADRDVSRAIRSWLHEDRHEDASRIAGAVLDRVDTTPRRWATWWPARRTPIMNKFVTIGLGAAAVVLAVFVGAQLLGSSSNGVGGPGADPTATLEPSAAATPVPTPMASAPEPTPAELSEGPFVLVYEQLFGVRMTVSVPAPDWHGLETSTVLEKEGMADPPQGAGLFVFGGDMLVYGDPCNWQSTTPDAAASSLDELVAALSAQASRNATAPVDATVGGYPAKKLTLDVPADVVLTDCDGGEFRTLAEVRTGDARFHQGPAQVDEVWVVDVQGTLVFIDAGYFADTPADHVEEMRAMVESATFEAP